MRRGKRRVVRCNCSVSSKLERILVRGVDREPIVRFLSRKLYFESILKRFDEEDTFVSKSWRTRKTSPREERTLVRPLLSTSVHSLRPRIIFLSYYRGSRYLVFFPLFLIRWRYLVALSRRSFLRLSSSARKVARIFPV